MYEDAVFDDRFRCQLVMFRIRLLTGLSGILHAHIAYEIDTAKLIAEFCQMSYCLHDLIRLNSFVCYVQTSIYTTMFFFVGRFRYQLTMFEVGIFIWLFRHLYTQLHMK